MPPARRAFRALSHRRTRASYAGERRPSPTMPASPQPPEGTARESPAHAVLRVLAIALGLPLATAALGAWLGVLIESPWISLGVAAVVLVLPALLLVDRLLPEDDPRKGRGIPTDVLSMLWLGLATLAFGPLGGLLHDPLVSLAQRAGGEGIVVTLAELATGPVHEDAASERGASDAARGEAADDDAGLIDAGPAATEGE